MSNLSVVHAQGSLRGTQREYECVMILKPGTTKDGIADLVSRVQAIFTKNGCRLQRIENWGLRTLAYPIASNKQGIYLYTQFLGGSDMVAELERNLRIYVEVIRYLTVKVDEDVDPSARPSEITNEQLAAAAVATPDPVEVARAEAEEAARREAEEAAKAAAEAEAAAAAAPAEGEEEAAATDAGEEPASE